MKFLALNLSYFSGSAHKTCPARCTNPLINCLFGSLILIFRVANKSLIVFPKAILPPCYNKLDRAYAAYFLFCQLPLSFILGKSLIISFERSLSFPSFLDSLFFTGLTLHYNAANPSNYIVAFF
jgi:hypothetical protein